MTDLPQQPPTLLDLRRTSAAAIDGGDLVNAEVILRDALTLAPNDPTALHNLGLVLFKSRRFAEAESAFTQSARAANQAVTWMVLAELYEATDRKGEAFRCYKHILKTNPNDYAALMRLGALKAVMGDKDGSRDCYRLALEARPNDFEATVAYADAIWEQDLETCVRLYEGLLATAGDNLNLRAYVLEKLTPRKEWCERIRRGQMPYHATSLNELFFTYAHDYLKDLDATHTALVAAKPDNARACISAGITRFALQDRHGAEQLFASAPGKTQGGILETVRFDPAFYDGLRAFTAADLTRGLPPILDVTPLSPDPRGTLYLSCNFSYFHAFALPMAVSLRDRSPGTPVHFHIMDADERETAFAQAFMQRLSPLKVAISVERPGLKRAPRMEARSYYHAVRFIRYIEHLERYQTPLWLMDVDAVINRDLSELFDMLNSSDVAMRIRPGRMEPWNQFNACVVGAGTTPASYEYFRLIAAYLAYFFQRKSLRWGIDQLAMYGVFADMQDLGRAPALALLGAREVDYDYRDDGFVWCNSGAGKFQHLQRISKPGSLPLADFTENRFVGVFEKYWRETQDIAATITLAP